METPTQSQVDQWNVQNLVFNIYDFYYSKPPMDQAALLKLRRDKHIKYLTKGLHQLNPTFAVLDANCDYECSRPWLCYWILHSLALLGESLDDQLEDNAIDFLSRCQMPHLLTTYAAVNSLVTLGGHKALSSIKRDKVYQFLRKMKDSSGAFRMHDGGEIDARACYGAISVASILNILDDELIKGVGDYILSCQTYEGGIGGEPGSEAHGGYTFCGLAAMVIINQANRLDLASLTDWVVHRQGVESGFQGRTNKLVDGCYSFWQEVDQGGVFPLLQRLQSFSGEGSPSSDVEVDWVTDGSSEDEDGDSLEDHGTCQHEEEGQEGHQRTSHSGESSISVQHQHHSRCNKVEPLFNSTGLQQYILLCSQMLENEERGLRDKPRNEGGGLRDKPPKGPDYYHTCYCLSGLSVCQYSWSKDENSPPLPSSVLGPYSNLLEPTHPVYNVVMRKYHEARDFFSNY
ncbi:Protein farnesyltransferase subunit beta [Linum perenne]